MWWSISTDVLDTTAAIVALPAVVGSKRLEAAREWTATKSGPFVQATRTLAKRLGKLSGALVAAWVLFGAFGFGRILDEALFLVFDADPGKNTALIILGEIAILLLPALIGLLVWVASRAMGAVLWLPARIARRSPLAHLLAGFAFVLFLAARVISIVLVIVNGS